MNEINYPRISRAGNVLRFGRSDKNPMRFGKRDGSDHHGIPSSNFCDDYDCLLQERENQLADVENDDQLSSLFGNENNETDDNAKSQQSKGYGEYIITK